MTLTSMIPPGFCGAFIDCCSTCANSLFIGKKPQTSACACSGAELHYNSAAHASACTVTLNVTYTALANMKNTIFIFPRCFLLYNTADFWHQLRHEKYISRSSQF